ncbi:unnamed protein product, partial [Ascophyllum nodosum]
ASRSYSNAARAPGAADTASSADSGRDQQPEKKKKKVVVVGGGWAGFGAAKALTEAGPYDVTLLDANPNPGGLSAGWRTSSGRSVEAGIKGFWWSYPNIYDLVERQLRVENPFTDWTRSSFFSPDGLQVEAPVLNREQEFPSPLGLFVHTRGLFTSLPFADRASMIPLLYAILDFERDEETYREYDKMTARELFRRFGVSKRLYEEFLKPILLVGLFAPPEELSAGVVLGMLYFYVLAHQPDFDVRWCTGPITEKLFAPLVDKIKANGGRVRGGMFVTDVTVDSKNKATSVQARNAEGGETVSFDADAVVLCVSIQGAKKLLSSCSGLGAARPDLRRAMSLKSVDVMATRLWFDRKVMSIKNPSNVIAGFENAVGGTFFHLNDLQDEYRDSEGSVIAADFYHASELLPLSDEEVTERVHRTYLSSCVPEFRRAQRACRVIDSWVGRFPQAVTCFSPGSYENRPRQASAGSNVFVAGDWVRGVDHGANGLSQERAYVTGLMAANHVMDAFSGATTSSRRATILPTEPDEPQVAVGKRANKAVRGTLKSLGFPDLILDFTVFPPFLP